MNILITELWISLWYLLLPTALCAISSCNHYVLLLHSNFGTEQFGSIFPHSGFHLFLGFPTSLFLPRLPYKIPYCSVVKYPYYMSSPLLTSMYVTRSMSLYNLYSFWNNSVLWGRVVNPTSNLQPGGKWIFIRASSPGESWLHASRGPTAFYCTACFMRLLHWVLSSFGNSASSYTTITIAPSYVCNKLIVHP